MRRLFFAAGLALTLATSNFAQNDFTPVEVFAGYSHARVDTGVNATDPALRGVVDQYEGFNGFNVAVTGNVHRYAGLRFDLSGHYKQFDFPFGPSRFNVDGSLYNLLGGVQIKDNATTAQLKPFGHALIGAARGRARVDNAACVAVTGAPCPPGTNDPDWGLAGAIGGGLDVRVADRVDIRVIQLDYNPTRLFDSTQHNFRIGVGIVFR